MQLLTTSIGRKTLMAITGQAMILFAVIHLIGNSSIFGWLPGGINAYAHHLHTLPAPIIIGFRLGLLVMFMIHVWFAIQLTLENRNGRPQQYAIKSTQQASFASENMIWTGSLLFIFIGYHLLHYTFQVISPETAALKNVVADIPNVYGMVVAGFQNFMVSLLYLVAMVTLFLHLSHGIQSSFQTLGWNNDRTMCTITKLGALAALVMFFGYVAVPLTILVKILK